MFALNVLPALFGFLLLSDAFTVSPQYEPASTPEYVYETTEGDFVSTPEYGTPDYDYVTSENGTTDYDYATPVYDYVTDDNGEYITTNYLKEKLTAQCGIFSETDFYVGTFSSGTYVEITSNTTENPSYSNNQDCTIRFITDDSSYHFAVIFTAFDLEYNNECFYDYVCVKGVKFCGNWTFSQTVIYTVPANDSLTIKFKSDSSVTRSGFLINVYPWRTSSDALSYEPKGVAAISSAEAVNGTLDFGYQSDYVDGCSQPNYGATTPSYGTDNDVFTDNYSPEGSTASPWGDSSQIIECGEGISYNYYYLDNGDNYYAFNSYNNNNNRYIIQSPNYGNGVYGNNTSCYIKFYAQSRKLLTVYYSDFDVELNNYCTFDSLCVNGVRFCGRYENLKYYYYQIPPNSWFTVKFSTDSSVVKSGFRAIFTFDNQYSVYGTYQVSGGDGSDESRLEYSTSSDSTYEDKCADDSYQTYTDEYVTDDYSYETPAPEPRPHNNGIPEYLAEHYRLVNEVIESAKERLNYASDLISAALNRGETYLQ